MNTKASIILKSFAELPSDAIHFVVRAPARAVSATRQVLAPPVRMTRRQIRAARKRSSEFMVAITARSVTSLHNIQPWPRGGLNE